MDGWNLFALLAVGAVGALVFLRQFALEIGRIERRVLTREAWQRRRIAEAEESVVAAEEIETVSPVGRGVEVG